MFVKYELDIAKILAKHLGLQLKDVHVETRKRERLHDRCVYKELAAIVRTFEDVNSDA